MPVCRFVIIIDKWINEMSLRVEMVKIFKLIVLKSSRGGGRSYVKRDEINSNTLRTAPPGYYCEESRNQTKQGARATHAAEYLQVTSQTVWLEWAQQTSQPNMQVWKNCIRARLQGNTKQKGETAVRIKERRNYTTEIKTTQLIREEKCKPHSRKTDNKIVTRKIERQ